MIRRLLKNLGVYEGDAPAGTAQLERDGWTMLPAVFEPAEVADLREAVDEIFATVPAERIREDKEEFRYELLNRSAVCQQCVGQPRILEVIEPLLGEDCHVIANTAWRNPADFAGGPWHCDAGPHIPRREGIEWDDRIRIPCSRSARTSTSRTARGRMVRPPSCPGATVPDGSRPSTVCTTTTSPTTVAHRS